MDTLAILKSLKASKSAGTDNIPSTLIKDGAEEIAAPLTFLINLSLQLGTFSTTEKTAKVTPIFKSGDRTLPDNYRPISVLNVFSKVLERIVYNQLSTFLERKNLLYRHQYGFRRHRSTEHAVTMFVDNLRMNTNNSQLTGAVYVDLRKKPSTPFIMLHYCTNYHPSAYPAKNTCGSLTIFSIILNMLSSIPYNLIFRG